MAISPWHIKSHLSSDEVAALLCGYTTSEIDPNDFEGQALAREWALTMFHAVRDGSLKAVYQAARLRRKQGPCVITKDGRDSRKGDFISFAEDWSSIEYASLGIVSEGWVEQGDLAQTELDDDEVLEVRLILERQEVSRWLRASGVADDDIPEALRVMPKPQAPATPQDKPLHHKRRQTYLKLIEGLALEVLDGEMPDEPYKAAGMLQIVLDSHGLKLDEETIAKVVMEIHAAQKERASDPFNPK